MKGELVIESTVIESVDCFYDIFYCLWAAASEILKAAIANKTPYVGYGFATGMCEDIVGSHA